MNKTGHCMPNVVAKAQRCLFIFNETPCCPAAGKTVETGWTFWSPQSTSRYGFSPGDRTPKTWKLNVVILPRHTTMFSVDAAPDLVWIVVEHPWGGVTRQLKSAVILLTFMGCLLYNNTFIPFTSVVLQSIVFFFSVLVMDTHNKVRDIEFHLMFV